MVVNSNSIMIKLIFLVFGCIQISTGYNDGFAGSNNFPSIENSKGPKWPVPIHYGEPQVQRRKPCPHRRSNAQASEQWTPLFRSLVTKPLDNYVLEPQALKHEKVDNTANESNVSQDMPTVDLSPINESNTEPIDDSVTSILDRPNRRSNAEERPDNRLEQSLNQDYDCDMDLDTKDYFDSQDGAQNSKTASNGTALVGVEQKVIDMLKDCINKKQKYIEDKLNQGEGTPISGSRRSMGDIDTDNDDLISVGDDDKQEVTDKSGELVSLLTSLDNNTNSHISSVPITKYETPHFTLRPGKLFNELQHPAKMTGIAEVPSRRMLSDNARICYACSTSTNPACWEPNNKTTIKYCRANQNCVTKSFGVEDSLTILRDCATSCDATSIPGVEPKYESCSVCYNDYCNSAATNNYNLFIIFLITAVKCTF